MTIRAIERFPVLNREESHVRTSNVVSSGRVCRPRHPRSGGARRRPDHDRLGGRHRERPSGRHHPRGARQPHQRNARHATVRRLHQRERRLFLRQCPAGSVHRPGRHDRLQSAQAHRDQRQRGGPCADWRADHRSRRRRRDRPGDG